jgi:hypothetical protein
VGVDYQILHESVGAGERLQIARFARDDNAESGDEIGEMTRTLGEDEKQMNG